jgi:prolyl-tRNA editing enzyme YbaK/EbsC (Cys-tRNA(Pro) deacylase)
MSNDDTLSRSAARVQAALAASGIEAKVVELPASTRTAAEAAAAVGCEIAQIAKSLVFRGLTSGEPLLVIASGANRVNEALVGEAAGEAIGKADAEFVRARVGFAIGGIPPVGHDAPLRTFIDEDLLRLDRVWAAAGTPHALFELSGADLPRLTGGRVLRVV